LLVVTTTTISARQNHLFLNSMRLLSGQRRFENLMAFVRKVADSSGYFADSGESSADDNDQDATKETSYKDDGEAVVASVQELHDNDVLCGRDKVSHSHPGNHRFRKIVELYRESYQKAPSREEKTRITSKVMEVIRSSQPQGRFLKYDDDTQRYFDVGDKYAHEKVSHALRSAKDPNRPKPKRVRVVPKRELTANEQEMCERVYQEQQKIFQALVEKSTDAQSSATLSLLDFDEEFPSDG